MAPLLPPVGSDVFRRFTPASLEEIQQRHEDKEKEGKRKTKTEVKNKLIRCQVNTVPLAGRLIGVSLIRQGRSIFFNQPATWRPGKPSHSFMETHPLSFSKPH